MFVEKIIFINRVPFEHLEIDFKQNGINVLSAVNGKGKTTVLSYIEDALHEMARPYYTRSFEGIENKYYRISSELDVIEQDQVSAVFIRFIDETDKYDYLDIRGSMSADDYKKEFPVDNKLNLEDVNRKISIQGGTCKIVSNNFKKEQALKVFLGGVNTFFPAYRNELPGYLNDPYRTDLQYKKSLCYSGELLNPIEVISCMDKLSNWIMDIVVDWEVYKNKGKVEDKNGNIIEIDRTPELDLWRNMSAIVSRVLCAKNDGGHIRFAIGKRNNAERRVSVVSDNNGIINTLAPNLFALSSGESSLLGLFMEIFRQGDNIQTNIKLDQIKGIVLVDEIDKHLHIRLQNEILPQLLNLFPNVQFIVSSHAPFFNMGLAEQASERSIVFDLDNNANSWVPMVDESYKYAYDKMISENEKYATLYKENAELVRSMTKPIVITEGKTDWKHIKAAFETIKGEPQYSSLDFCLYEFSDNQGDGELNKRLLTLSKVPNRYKIIGVFDCDEDNGKSIHQKSNGIKHYGNNVYGMSIPIPDFRSDIDGISIEFLYKDDDLKKKDAKNRRLYVTSEFNENGRLISDKTIGVRNADKIKQNILHSKEKIKDNDVFDLDDRSLALSKEEFATNVLDKIEPYNNMDFSAFYAVFDRLKSIIDDKNNQ